MRWPLMLRATHDKAMAAVEAKLMESLDPKLMGINFQGRMLELNLKGGVAQVIAAAFAEQFVKQGGQNYLEMGFTHETLGPLTVTIQRVYGKTPGQKVALMLDTMRVSVMALAFAAERDPTFNEVYTKVSDLIAEVTRAQSPQKDFNQ